MKRYGQFVGKSILFLGSCCCLTHTTYTDTSVYWLFNHETANYKYRKLQTVEQFYVFFLYESDVSLKSRYIDRCFRSTEMSTIKQ